MSEVDKIILLQLTGKTLVIFSHTVHNFFFHCSDSEYLSV